MWCLPCGTQLCSLTDYNKPHFLNKCMSQIEIFTTGKCSTSSSFCPRRPSGTTETEKVPCSVFNKTINRFNFFTIINHMIVQVKSQLFAHFLSALNVPYMNITADFIVLINMGKNMLTLCKCMFIIIITATIQNNEKYRPEYPPE